MTVSQSNAVKSATLIDFERESARDNQIVIEVKIFVERESVYPYET